GGGIFLQIMHTGRIGHPLNLPPNANLVAPSAIKPETTKMWVDGEGLLEIPDPKEMTSTEIQQNIAEHVTAAKHALKPVLMELNYIARMGI
ncbi:MAG: hypothetical protein ABIR06_23490, partial [Cyclobacteriaceae bacterium]